MRKDMAEQSKEGTPQFRSTSLSLYLPSEKSQKKIKINKTKMVGIEFLKTEYNIIPISMDYLYFTDYHTYNK